MIYDCQCSYCGKIQEIVRKLADREDTPFCCGERMFIKISAPHVSTVNFVTSDITGNPVEITSHKQHDKLCKENDVAPMGVKGEF